MSKKHRKALPTLSLTVPKADLRSAPPPPKQQDRIYGTSQYAEWRDLIIARANGKCEGAECSNPHAGGKLFADHIKEVRDNPELAFDPRNGQALCFTCHNRKTIQERIRRAGEVYTPPAPSRPIVDEVEAARQ